MLQVCQKHLQCCLYWHHCGEQRVMLSDTCWLPPQNYQEALHYIGKLPFDQAESNMKRYGKILMHHVPKETTELLKNLCTDYQPTGDSEGPGILEGKKVWFALTERYYLVTVTLWRVLLHAWLFRHSERPHSSVPVVLVMRLSKLLPGTDDCSNCTVMYLLWVILGVSCTNFRKEAPVCLWLGWVVKYFFFFLVILQANSEEFIPVFANNSRELKAFLEHMTEVQSDSPQGVYDTLLELRLQNWAHELDEQVWSLVFYFKIKLWCLGILIVFLPAP